jgi:hypothetical protein
MVEHFDALAVLHHSSFLVDRGHVVAQHGLHSRNVGNLEHATATAIAGRQQQKKEKGNTGKEWMESVLHRLAIQYNASLRFAPTL